jgi:hypothetical protein
MVIANAWYLVLRRINLLAAADYLKDVCLRNASESVANEAFMNLRAP